ncbi:hypothetical protein QJ857_gp0562 [Tupanvirus soda lake]|uniref:Uncharacterized protein n=2 Tax=Tupanvirus TaxID=2094720 RepID=A0A6N1P3A5_9VIRU|nr:hypothetical protein QJ857_gp0562 [Tupanvirus soda lake]QKU35481.1 hypothetical protein [Tupanvirus soda lake]
MSSKNAYRLINPYIEGSLDTVVRASNSFSAGKKLYNTISDFFTNHVDDFYMTIQNVETKELSHFKIGEKRSDNGMVDFKLIKLDDRFKPDLEKKLVTNIEKLSKQSGGRHHHRRHYDDDDDDTTSESTTEERDYYYRIPIQPITRFVYFYLPYYKLNAVGLSPLDTTRIFMPMFNLPINPSLEIRFDLFRYP